MVKDVKNSTRETITNFVEAMEEIGSSIVSSIKFLEFLENNQEYLFIQELKVYKYFLEIMKDMGVSESIDVFPSKAMFSFFDIHINQCYCFSIGYSLDKDKFYITDNFLHYFCLDTKPDFKVENFVVKSLKKINSDVVFHNKLHKYIVGKYKEN